MKNNQQQHAKVMDSESMPVAQGITQSTSANEAAIHPKLQEWVDFVELLPKEVEPVHQAVEVAPFIKEAEEIRKVKAEKRLDAKLRKLEVEQKERLLAEAKESIEEARRKFEAQPQVPYDYTPGPPTCIEDVFRAEKARNDLIALEREQKEELLKQVMEERAKKLGDDWPRIQEMSQDVRFDHIPKLWPGYKGLIPNYFHDHPLLPPQQSNEPPAASSSTGSRPQSLERI